MLTTRRTYEASMAETGGGPPWLERAAGVLALLLCAIVTYLIYGHALSFSFFFDDAYDLTRTESMSFRDLLGPMAGYGYYRPIPFMIWKALYLLLGHYDRLALHLLPLAAHALAGWCLFLLLRRLTGSLWSIVPAVLFLLFPFSYQAVPIIGTVFHPLVTAEILAALVLWYDARTRGSRWRFGLATLLAVLALWTHEFGAAVFPLLAALEGLLWLQRRVERPTLWLLAPLAAEVLFLGVWHSIDKPGPEHVTLRDMARNARFGLQGFAYPVARQTIWVAERIGVRPVALVGPLALLGVLAGLGAYVLGRAVKPALGAIALAGFAFLPAVGTLTYAYMENGPRLLYVVAPGAAAFWGLLPMLRWRDPRLTFAWRAATLGLLAVVAVQSVAFIRVRLDMLDQGTRMLEGIIFEGQTHPGDSLLILNAPAWFAPKTQEYPLGHLGVQIAPSYIGLDRLIYVGSHSSALVESRSLAPDVSGWRYNFEPHGPPIDHAEVDARLRQGVTLVAVDPFRDQLAVREPGAIQPRQPAPTGSSAVFGDGLWLLDASLSERDGLATVACQWYVAHPLDGDYQVWIQLRRPDGSVAAERRDYALRGMSPPRLWQAGDLVEDRLVLDLSGVSRAEPLTAWLSLVSSGDGTPLPMSSSRAADAGGWLEVGTSVP